MPNLIRYTLLWLVILLFFWSGNWLFQTWQTADQARIITPRGSLSDSEQQTIQLFAQSSPSVAYIFTEQTHQTLFGNINRDSGAGSGFIWDGAGHIVTNYHVVKGASRILVKLDSGNAIPAKLVGAAANYDLAVLRLITLYPALKPIPLGSSAQLQVGQAVFAIGNPFGLSRTLTTGIISALNRRLPTANGREIAGVIQTDAAINPGNSGGPLLDSAGRLIGVNTAIMSESGTSAGIGFAVPVDVVNRIVPLLIRQEKIPTPGIGITAAEDAITARLGISGVVITEVVPGLSADQAGLQGIDFRQNRLGDIITHVNGQRVATLTELSAELANIGIGKMATLTLIRNEETREVAVLVVDLP